MTAIVHLVLLSLGGRGVVAKEHGARRVLPRLDHSARARLLPVLHDVGEGELQVIINLN